MGEAEEFFALDCAGVVLRGLISRFYVSAGVGCTLSSFMKRFRILSTSSRSTGSLVSIVVGIMGAKRWRTVGALNNVL